MSGINFSIKLPAEKQMFVLPEMFNNSLNVL